MRCIARLTVASLFLFSFPGMAGELKVVWNDPAGRTLVEGLVKLPGRITQTHLDSLRLRFKDPLLPVSRAKGLKGGELEITPTVVAGDFTPDLSVRAEKNLEAGEIDLVPDWSGGEVHLTPRPEYVSSCYLYGGAFAGMVFVDQTFTVYVYSAMTVVAVVDVSKGDPDLYISDSFGTLICASTMSGKLPEDCAVLNLSCGNSDMLVQVHGYKKKNMFVLGIWSTENY